MLNVRVDGGIVQSYPEPAVAEADYTERVIDLSAFADGAAHNIEFEYIGPSSGVGSYVVEVFTPDGTVAGNLLFIGSNADPESAPSYLSAAACGITADDDRGHRLPEHAHRVQRQCQLR